MHLPSQAATYDVACWTSRVTEFKGVWTPCVLEWLEVAPEALSIGVESTQIVFCNGFWAQSCKVHVHVKGPRAASCSFGISVYKDRVATSAHSSLGCWAAVEPGG